MKWILALLLFVVVGVIGCSAANLDPMVARNVSGKNWAPVATINSPGGRYFSPEGGATVTFSGTGTDKNRDDVLSYHWEVWDTGADPDTLVNTFDVKDPAPQTYGYSIYYVYLTVSDNHGGVSNTAVSTFSVWKPLAR